MLYCLTYSIKILQQYIPTSHLLPLVLILFIFYISQCHTCYFYICFKHKIQAYWFCFRQSSFWVIKRKKKWGFHSYFLNCRSSGSEVFSFLFEEIFISLCLTGIFSGYWILCSLLFPPNTSKMFLYCLWLTGFLAGSVLRFLTLFLCI